MLIYLYSPLVAPHVCQISARSKQVRVVFVFVQKEKKNEEQKLKLGSLVSRKHLALFASIWNVASPNRQALPQQIWCASDLRWRIYECVKIATLLFLLIYSLPFARTLISRAAQHTTMCVDTKSLRCLVEWYCIVSFCNKNVTMPSTDNNHTYKNKLMYLLTWDFCSLTIKQAKLACQLQ